MIFGNVKYLKGTSFVLLEAEDTEERITNMLFLASAIFTKLGL